ncbi:YVTN family beta-propeller repeat protein [Herbaspirillum sp. CF444]|uniref:YncE family protein n=1 Tax=Herbaspirillum sp. CF444 TaxID=1144319 RepID=UPI0002724090|nr:YVTN family beta-propeller repeat protein [Herbaspirillum sp. CF444]
MRMKLVTAISILFVLSASAALLAMEKTPMTDQYLPLPLDGIAMPKMLAISNESNLYRGTAPSHMSPTVADALERIYVPNHSDNTVSVIDPETLKVIDTFMVGANPQHVVPAWDLRTLWVANNAEGRKDGSLTPIDPITSKPGKAIMVDDPYNLYWSPDGRSAIVVAEAHKRLDFRDPHTMKLQYSIATPQCGGINHADFSIDGRYVLFTCEFDGSITKIDMDSRAVVGTLKLCKYFDRLAAVESFEQPSKKPKKIPDSKVVASEICTGTGMPQDVRVSPDGKTFFVADMMADGVHVVDGESLKQIDFISTGVGAHGLYPSRDGDRLYVANRGSHDIHGKQGGKGSVSVIDYETRTLIKTWPIPGGGSPDMGGVSADGKFLWLSGRFDDVVYRFDTTSGDVKKIKVGREPHGLAVWPQPGTYSLGHTGNMR